MGAIRVILIIVFVFIGVRVWAFTPHQDFAFMDIIELCNNCHRLNDAAPTHGGMWMKEHRLHAEKQPNNCIDCHQRSFCLDCHTGGGIDSDLNKSSSGVNYVPRSHRTDFREIHPIRAFDDPASCYRCHDQKRFCSECHTKFNPNDLRFTSHRKGYSNIEVSAGGPQHSAFTSGQCDTCHPNSVLPLHRWSASHSREARKNLSSCQACHSEGDVCLKCHSAMSGLKVNPHPKNWSKIAERLRDAGKNRSCEKCHL